MAKPIPYQLVKKRRKKGMSLVQAITTPINTSKQNRLKKPMEREYHIDGTLPDPASGVILTFGSNNQGYHSFGAALVAAQKFGAVRYEPEGHFGNSYAIPTRWWHHGFKRMFTLPLEVIEENIARFCEYTKSHPELRFFVTAVGCGLAGYSYDKVAPLFKDAINCSFPEEWDVYLED